MKELPVKKELPVVENESVNNPQKMLNVSYDCLFFFSFYIM